MTFRITPRGQAAPVEIEAGSVGEAASAYAKRTHGKRATAERTTGDHGKSGYFQAYTPMGASALNSVGESFHVFPLD